MVNRMPRLQNGGCLDPNSCRYAGRGLYMKRFLFFLFTFILIISAAAILMHEYTYESPAAGMILEAFQKTGADAVVSEIYIRGEKAAGQLDRSVSAKLLGQIVRGTGAEYSSDAAVFYRIETDFASGEEINYIIDEYKNVRLTILDEAEDTGSSRFFITFTDTSRDPDLQKCAGVVTNVLESLGIDYEMNIAVTGSIGRRLSDDEIDEIFDKVFECTGAEKREGINDNGLISVSAFSPEIGGKTGMDGHRTNLNIAVRYNSYEGKTYIWLATPVIITEY